MKHFDVFYNREQHVSRLLTSWILLQRSGGVTVRFIENTNNFRGTPHPQIVEAEYSGKRLAFDMCDAFALNNVSGKEYLSRVDAYFKRSYSRSIDEGLSSAELSKIRPYGFDYYSTCPENPINVSSVGLPQKAKNLLRNLSGYSKCTHAEFFEQKADYKEKDIKIIFMTRLWDPNEIHLDSVSDPEIRAYREYMIQERHQINQMRIQLVRELRKAYPRHFVGGIQESEFSAASCPDLLIPKKLTRKKAYLTQMQSSDICIGSTGLHKSIGWKTGEYVAAARSIISERLCYEVTGSFIEGINYISFDSADECLDAVGQLYSDPERIYKMKLANEQYYREYLKPERQLMNALEQFI